MRASFYLLVCLSFPAFGQSALPPCDPNVAVASWSNCQGTYTQANGIRYVGEWRDGKRHGQGTVITADGDRYVGELRDNKNHGQGTATWANGNEYVGEWRDNKQHGQGTTTFASGNMYVGEWRDNKRNGQGTATWANGDKYVGEFRDDQYHGQGIVSFADQRPSQEGFWQDHKFVRAERIPDHIAGRTSPITSPLAQAAPLPVQAAPPVAQAPRKAESAVERTWQSALPPCNANVASTSWTNCQGIDTFADGSKYVGEFRDGKRHGQGTYTFASGNRYVGKFRNNTRHGKGTYMLANGTPLREGIWESDRFVGSEVSQPAAPPPSRLNLARKKCGDLGLKSGTEKFGECVLKLSR